MRKLPPLKAIHAFETASRLGSFVAAAEELHLTPSAVSHRIRDLEQALGVALFHRIHRTVVLTDAGRRYAAGVADAFGRLEAATDNVARTRKRDLLTVHAVPSLAAQWLAPRIPRFTASYRSVDVRLHASVEIVDLEDGAVDFAIRYGSVLQRSGIATERFPQEPIVVLCSPALWQRKRGLRRPEDLVRFTLIHSEVNLYGWRDWQRDHPRVALNLERGPRFDRSFLSIGAAIDGLGVCLESLLLVERELESGRLVLPFGAEGPRIGCHSLNYLASRARVPKVRAFRDWLFGELAESPALHGASLATRD